MKYVNLVWMLKKPKKHIFIQIFLLVSFIVDFIALFFLPQDPLRVGSFSQKNILLISMSIELFLLVVYNTFAQEDIGALESSDFALKYSQWLNNIQKPSHKILIVILMIFNHFWILGHSPSRKPVRAVQDISLQFFNAPSRKLSDLKVGLTILHFWATWCEACMQELPEFITFERQFRNKNIAILAVNLDERPDIIVPKIQKKFKADFPVVIDPHNVLSETFFIQGIPTTIILDHQKNILQIFSGELHWTSEKFIKKIEGLLQQASPVNKNAS